MKALLALIMAVPLAAQEPPAKAEPAATEQGAAPADAAAKPQEAKTEAAPATEKKAESPVPVPPGEKWFSGNVEVGYRFRSDVGGNFNAYRSVVDLGEGPKLLGLDLSFQDPKRRAFDRIDVKANNWGGDPYNTARLDARKEGVYRFSADYRNQAYFNFLPSFANPLVDRGVLLNERSFDIHRRFANIELELRPGKRIVPFLTYSHDAGYGRGITTFVSNSNEYPVPNDLRDSTNRYSGGLRLELNRFHMTLEQGGTTFKDDQRVYATEPNQGNRTTPFFGEQLFLETLQQAYGVRGDSIYSKAMLTANPVSWLDVYGQFLYSLPRTDVSYSQFNTGSFALGPGAFYSSQLDFLNAEAKQPHTSGSGGFELRPLRRVRIIESLMTDRLHVTSAGLLAEQILSANLNNPFTDRLVVNYNQQQVDVLVDVTSKLTLRGGHRFVWGDAIDRAPSLSGTDFERGEIRRQVGLAGFNLHFNQKFSVNADFEGASSSRSYFRTSLHDYQRGRVRARYQALTNLSFTASMGVLNNQNPVSNYDFLSRDTSVAAFWTPGGGRRFSLLADYTRSSLHSDINYLAAPFFDLERSFYRDDAHSATTLLEFGVPVSGQKSARLGVGGSLFISSGSRPTSYYQPLARLSLPLHKNLEWFSEWRWYGFGETFYLYEGFRAHTFVTGLRFTR
jgi:hypothetical protein